MLQFQQLDLPRDAAAIAGETAACAHDAVARDHERDRVVPDRPADGLRGQMLQLKSQEYIVAAEAMGAKSSRIIAKHLIPNALSVIIINVTLAIPSAIFTEAFLSYIGLGVPVPQPSWGVLAKGGQDVFMTYPYQLVVPAVAISLTMLSFNLLGDGLRDAFDPRLRR